ncbi:hypothetical protein GIB67_004550 [Kingdonia uniflora]|uniref:Uncharacterized protein n=1 Tax=Kingdonia uniflora TaxID=39325 RepID=A0A7J7MKZ6_9MAGN|nr:hypothetical protein GIB67_004550 [Kingdonia uniflora]
MVKTRSHRDVKARVLNDLRLAFKIDEIREAVFGQQGYDAVLLETRANNEGKTDAEKGKEMNRVEEIINEDMDIASRLLKACGVVGHTGLDEQTAQFRNRGLLTGKHQTASGLGKGGKDKRKAATRSLDYKLREEAEIEEVLKKLQKLSKLIIMASIFGCAKADEADLVGHLSPVIGVGGEEDIIAKLIELPRLKGARVDVNQGGDYLYLLPDLAKEKKRRNLGDEISLEYVLGIVKDSRTDGFCCYLAQFDYALTLPLSNLAKSVMNVIGACLAQLNCNFLEAILVCETQNGRWATSGSERRIIAKHFLEYYAVKYVTATDGAYLSSSSSRPCFFDLSSAGRVWNDNLLWVSGINCKVLRKESFIDVVAREGTELEAVLKELEISRFQRVASKDDKVSRSQAKRRMAGKITGSMEEKLSTPELNTPLKLMRLNEMPDGPVDMVVVSCTVVRNLAKRMAVKRGAASRSVTSDSVDDSSKGRKVTSSINSQEVLEESDKIAEGADLRPHFEVETGLLEEQCRAKAREKMVAAMDDEFKKFARALREVELGFHDRSIELEKRISQLEGERNQLEENLTQERETFQLEREKEREAAALKLKEVKAESEAEAERLVSASATSRNNLAGKLYQLRYTKAEIMAFREGNYEMEIMDEEEVEEREDGLNVTEKIVADNQETIIQELESSRLRVVDLEGLLEVEKKSSVELQVLMCEFLLTIMQKELDVVREREEKILLYNAEYAKEYEAWFLQYEDRLDDNVKLSLKLEEAKRQVEQKTATILSRDLALNQLTSELAELKEKAASGSRHEAELAEYHIRTLNEEISDMKCNIHALNGQLLKREIELDTARTNLAMSEANFEKLGSSIMGKDRELHNSAQIHDSLIARLDRVKADLRHLKGRDAQSRANLAEIQTKNKSLVDDLAHARGNVRRVVQREKEMNERINQLCARISKSQLKLRVREMKYQKDLKFELD